MSCDKWNYTEQCEGRPCPGDCDNCSFDPYEYTVEGDTVDMGESQQLKGEQYETHT